MVIDRFCRIGHPDCRIRRLEHLRALGVDQFALYLQHDSTDPMLGAYGGTVIPAVHARSRAHV